MCVGGGGGGGGGGVVRGGGVLSQTPLTQNFIFRGNFKINLMNLEYCIPYLP